LIELSLIEEQEAIKGRGAGSAKLRAALAEAA